MNIETLNEKIAIYFSNANNETVGFLCNGCGHVASPGQKAMYETMCPGCGTRIPLVAVDRGCEIKGHTGTINVPARVRVFFTAWQAAQALRGERGDLFATESEMNMFRTAGEILRDVLESCDVKVVEYYERDFRQAFRDYTETINRYAECKAIGDEMAADVFFNDMRTQVEHLRELAASYADVLNLYRLSRANHEAFAMAELERRQAMEAARIAAVTDCQAVAGNGMRCELNAGHEGEHNAHYVAGLCKWTTPEATSSADDEAVSDRLFPDRKFKAVS